VQKKEKIVPREGVLERRICNFRGAADSSEERESECATGFQTPQIGKTGGGNWRKLKTILGGSSFEETVRRTNIGIGKRDRGNIPRKKCSKYTNDYHSNREINN